MADQNQPSAWDIVWNSMTTEEKAAYEVEEAQEQARHARQSQSTAFVIWLGCFAALVALTLWFFTATGMVGEPAPPPGTMPCLYDNGEPSFTPCIGNDGEVVR